ncbi:MAG: cysteine--tRNA ligase [Candidatus Pacebacteria bacterium]|nr:cysteine--tRNA ligase [Candidatus Paceibacterota bacterium]
MLKIYNTLSGNKENFKNRGGKKVNLFVCGPTVYDYSHVGHARTYVIFDVIVKYLKQMGFRVFYLQNITDIDDKIIARAKEKNTTSKLLAKEFEKEYKKNMKELSVNSVTRYAKATLHIKEIIKQVERLLKKGYAYQLNDGIYYDISRFKDYGKLSRRTSLQAEDAVSRIDENLEKRNKGDFCLWKFSKPEDPQWKSPWGKGRPGWHIEDTAITEKFFGPQYDIHGGAKDLIFPHHEAEIAQMEAISGKSPLVKYWMHTGFLTVEGQKMSKSLGNFITINNFLGENSSRLLRLLIVKSHYRSPLDFSQNLIFQTKNELSRIDEFTDKIKIFKEPLLMDKREKRISRMDLPGFEKRFQEAMEDDFNTPKAIAVIFDLISKANGLIDKDELFKKDAKNILNFFKLIDKSFCFILTDRPKEIIPQEVQNLVKEREECRKNQEWQKADEIREKIKDSGYLVEDTEEGPKIRTLPNRR